MINFDLWGLIPYSSEDEEEYPYGDINTENNVLDNYDDYEDYD